MQKHITVLLDEAVNALALKRDAVVVDATFGSGGHALCILEKLGGEGIFIGIDADELAIKEGRERTRNVVAQVHLRVGNHRAIGDILHELNIENVDAILADLGWRMEQFSGNGKGFSFQVDEPLVMTYGDPRAHTFTAHTIVNEWEEESIRNILVGYGEERFAARIAAKIVSSREEKPIETTLELARIVTEALPPRYRYGRIHPATKTFQALRIAVNDELGTLETFIKASVALLSPKGRLAIITFHSLEDRIVKHLMRSFVHDQVGVLVHKKPITPERDEVRGNPRARSAKLRVFEKQ